MSIYSISSKNRTQVTDGGRSGQRLHGDFWNRVEQVRVEQQQQGMFSTIADVHLPQFVVVH